MPVGYIGGGRDRSCRCGAKSPTFCRAAVARTSRARHRFDAVPPARECAGSSDRHGFRAAPARSGRARRDVTTGILSSCSRAGSHCGKSAACGWRTRATPAANARRGTPAHITALLLQPRTGDPVDIQLDHVIEEMGRPHRVITGHARASGLGDWQNPAASTID